MTTMRKSFSSGQRPFMEPADTARIWLATARRAGPLELLTIVCCILYSLTLAALVVVLVSS